MPDSKDYLKNKEAFKKRLILNAINKSKRNNKDTKSSDTSAKIIPFPRPYRIPNYSEWIQPEIKKSPYETKYTEPSDNED